MGKGSRSRSGQRDLSGLTPPNHDYGIDLCAPVGGGDVVVDRATLLKLVQDNYLTPYGCLPGTGNKWDLVTAAVETTSKGDDSVKCDVLGVDHTVQGWHNAVITEHTNESGVGPGGEKTFGVEIKDQNCDGKADIALAADFQIVIQEGGAVTVELCVSCFLDAKG